MAASGEGAGIGMGWEFGVSRCNLLHLEWVDNEGLLYITGNCVQSLGIEHVGDDMRKRMCVCVCVCIYVYIYIYVCLCVCV